MPAPLPPQALEPAQVLARAVSRKTPAVTTLREAAMATVTLTSIDRHGRLVLVPSKVAPEELFRHQRRCVAGAEL